MCPSCRAFITTSDRVCPYCSEPVVARAVDTRNPGALLGGLIPVSKFTTSLILLLNIGVFIASTYGGLAGEELLNLGEKNSAADLTRPPVVETDHCGFSARRSSPYRDEHVGVE